MCFAYVRDDLDQVVQVPALLAPDVPLLFEDFREEDGVEVAPGAEQDDTFWPIVERAARLICTTPEYAELWESTAGTHGHTHHWSPAVGATNPTERARLRAELDGLIAHLYDLIEEEFRYILTTFPLVPEPVKVAAQNAYRDVERGLIP